MLTKDMSIAFRSEDAQNCPIKTYTIEKIKLYAFGIERGGAD